MLALADTGVTGADCPQTGTAGGGADRAEVWLAKFRAACEARGSMEVMIDVLHEGLAATTTIRAPDPSAERGWSYRWTQDVETRLSALRIGLAYLCGNPPSQADIRVSGIGPGDTRARLTVGERLAELRAIGVTLESVVESIRRETSGAMVDVSPASQSSHGAVSISDQRLTR